MRCFLLQKRPDGQTAWADEEGSSYNFARRLPNAKKLCKGNLVLFYQPLHSGTPEDGCVYAQAIVDIVELGGDGLVDARLTGFARFTRLVPLAEVGDLRRNRQHSFQPVRLSFVRQIDALAGESLPNG